MRNEKQRLHANLRRSVDKKQEMNRLILSNVRCGGVQSLPCTVGKWRKGKGTVNTNKRKDQETIASIDEALQDCTTA